MCFLKKISTFNVVKNTTLGLSCVWKKKLSRLMLQKKLFKKKKGLILLKL
jgi:hypothetical protein